MDVSEMIKDAHLQTHKLIFSAARMSMRTAAVSSQLVFEMSSRTSTILFPPENAGNKKISRMNLLRAFGLFDELLLDGKMRAMRVNSVSTAR